MILSCFPFRVKVLCLLALVLVGCALIPVRPAQAAQSDEPRWGRVYNISGNIAVRENPSDDALKVRALKAGQRVRVDFQDAGWAAVFDPKEFGRSELKAWGYVRLDELHLHGAPAGAAVSSIEVRKPRPDAKPEVMVNGKPVKPDKPVVKAPKAPDRAASKPAQKPAPKPAAKADNSFGEIRVPDRDLAVRASRTTESEFKKLIRPGQRVRVDFLEDGWFAVFDPAEKTRDLAKAWGFSRDKYLVAESAYSGPPPGAVAAAPASNPAPVPARGEKAKAADEPAVGYAVVGRKTDQRKPPVVTLRVRLDLSQPPAPDALRKIVREIWKAERKKDENLQLEVLLNGMDAHGLAYALARFHADGRIREFWWREVVLSTPEK
jgi:hypothetical protein